MRAWLHAGPTAISESSAHDDEPEKGVYSARMTPSRATKLRRAMGAQCFSERQRQNPLFTRLALHHDPYLYMSGMAR